MDAVEEAIGRMAEYDDVRFVSFKQLEARQEAQDPAVLRTLRTLTPGQAPAGGWAEFLGGAGSKAS
jgi:hypothetical protein